MSVKEEEKKEKKMDDKICQKEEILIRYLKKRNIN